MANYLILNLVFMAIVLLLLRIRPKRPGKTWLLTLLVLLTLTAIFDSLIILAGIVAYDTTQLLGLYLWAAPIEDFFYTVLAVILVPTLWQRFSRTEQA